MSTYIPPDIARYIQDFLVGTEFVKCFLICSSFQKPLVNTSHFFDYINPDGDIPEWVTRIKLGDKITGKTMVETKSVTILHLGKERKIDPLIFKKFPNLISLNAGMVRLDPKAFKYLPHLKKLTFFNIDPKKIPTNLTHITAGGDISNTELLQWNPYYLNLLDDEYVSKVGFQHMTNLRILDVRWCRNISIHDLKDLPLECLFLNGTYNSINGFGPIKIPNLKKLFLFHHEKCKSYSVTGNNLQIIHK